MMAIRKDAGNRKRPARRTPAALRRQALAAVAAQLPQIPCIVDAYLDASTLVLLRFLDLTIEAAALASDIDADVASFAMMAALTAAERVGISDESAYHLRDSAIAALRRG